MGASALLDPGGFGCVPRGPGYLWTLGRLRLEAPRGHAPSGRHHNEPQVFVTRAEAPPGKTQELECLFSSETFDFAQGLTELSGPGPRFPDETPRPPGGLGRHLPQPARSRRCSDAGWVPGGAALDGVGQAKRHRSPRAQ